MFIPLIKRRRAKPQVIERVLSHDTVPFMHGWTSAKSELNRQPNNLHDPQVLFQVEVVLSSSFDVQASSSASFLRFPSKLYAANAVNAFAEGVSSIAGMSGEDARACCTSQSSALSKHLVSTTMSTASVQASQLLCSIA